MAEKRLSGDVTCWTKDDTTQLFFAITSNLNSAEVKFVRASSITMENNSGDCRIQAAHRTANNPYDVANWSAPTGFGPTRIADGTAYEDTGWTDISAALANKKFVQLGIMARNNTAANSATEACMGAVVIDVRSA